MKWFSPSHKTTKKSLSKKKQRTLSLCLVKVMVCPFIGSLILSGDVPQWKPKTLASIPSELVEAKVNQIAANITVKIYGQNFLGSGIILHNQDQEYVVLTNQHVLRAGEAPFTIKTPNGKIYRSEVLTPENSSQDDLALLSFKSDRDQYKTANTGDYSQLQEGELIFAAGFPMSGTEQLNKTRTALGLTFTTGQVAAVLDKPLQEGYQIAYTNDIQRGMSGGPLLDKQGKLVGVNGKQAYPLWEAPDFYEDNSQPCEPLQELITRSSLAIPVEKALALASQANLTINSSYENSLELPQNDFIFSTIPKENNYLIDIEAKKISDESCQ